MKKSALKKIYFYDEKKQAYLIEVALDSYREIFNDWDASPTRKKDLNPELVVYLEAASYDIPKRNKVIISFSLPQNLKNIKYEQKVISGIHNYCESVLYFTGKRLKFDLRKLALFIILGFTFIMTAFVVKNQLLLSLGFDVLIEGLFIGGWVLLWEAFSLFFFSMHELRNKKAMYLRFVDSEFEFNYR